MPERVPAVLGLDLGTSEAKAALVSLDGRLLGLGRGPYATDVGGDGRAEQDPRDWWRAIELAVRAIGPTVAGMDVLAVCSIGQGPTLVAVDADGDPVRPAVTWQDRRAGAGGYGLLPRMAWLAREDPVRTAQARWLMASWDAVGLWLTGTAATSIQAHEEPLAVDALVEAGVRPDAVPPPLAYGSRLGTLRTEVAGLLGLPAGIPVIAGVNDGTASMLGAGLRAPGDAVDTGGTSGGIGIYADRPVELPGVFLAPAPLPGRWVVGGAMAALGASVDWMRSTVLGDRWTPDQLFVEAASVPPGAEGLIFLPYMAGERAPIFDEDARGAFVGLTLAHRRAHLVRAVLEGAAFAMRHVAEPLALAGAPALELRLAGRPSPGDLWARIKADVLGVPAVIPTVGETAVLGAAILAAAGSGAVPSLEAGVAAMTSVARRLEPDLATRTTYDDAFRMYRELYPALRPLFHGQAGR